MNSEDIDDFKKFDEILIPKINKIIEMMNEENIPTGIAELIIYQTWRHYCNINNQFRLTMQDKYLDDDYNK